MENSTAIEVKTCGMCRENINIGASICPHCKSATNYDYLHITSNEKLVRNTSQSRKFVNFLVIATAMIIGFLFGLALFGIWGGIGGALIFYKISDYVDNMFPFDTYSLSLRCPECSNEDQISWNASKFDEFNGGMFDCPQCSKKSMIVR